MLVVLAVSLVTLYTTKCVCVCTIALHHYTKQALSVCTIYIGAFIFVSLCIIRNAVQCLVPEYLWINIKVNNKYMIHAINV